MRDSRGVLTGALGPLTDVQAGSPECLMMVASLFEPWPMRTLREAHPALDRGCLVSCLRGSGPLRLPDRETFYHGQTTPVVNFAPFVTSYHWDYGVRMICFG